MKFGKRLLSAILVLAMSLTFVLTGCSSEESQGSAAASGSTAQSGTEKAGKKLNVAILLNGTLGDKAFFDSAANGAKMMESELGCTTKVIEMTADETKWLPALTDASENPDYDIIIVGTWQMAEKLAQIAAQYPDKKYIIFDSSVDYKDGKCKNVYSIEYKQNECSYLAGVAGALSTKTGKIGFVGGMENTVINDFLVGYIQGAKAANPNIKVLTSYVGNFTDTAHAKELTLAQINQGADVVFQAASNAGLGVIDGCTAKGKFVIGVDSDQALAFQSSDPAKANAVLTSALKRVDISITKAVKEAQAGTLKFGEAETLGLADNCVGLGTYNKGVSKDVQDKVTEFAEKIKSGSIKVDTAFGKSTSEIEAVKKSVRP
ncbi:BMP family lipoprotein [Caproiciproducens galactitolivorans]|uniref:BMP family ABC transporter substrate-binding protein n=1 Tax=Caproiciproducens galactitolivorans TaxID=642589 RepID=A0ABT4BSX9_9FIRM|nr:BMP family ABC transporter substrate-binding protein [Caproiciproducens galactitolivorans]MCY1713425.1 BMP family ABC transporter substrate-binding protein [Caproiciproducens galactitolivorans]